MKNQNTIILFLLFLTFSNAYSQEEYLPLDLAKKIFSRTKFPDLKKYCTGEYEGKPCGKDIDKNSTLQFLLLSQIDDKAVVAITIINQNEQGLDTYLHFSKEKIWKANAFRALAMTGILQHIKEELEQISSKQVDSIIATSKNDQKAMFTSREDYDFQLGNISLTLALDSIIIEHFNKNYVEFERLKDIALHNLDTTRTEEDGTVNLCIGLEDDFHKLFITSIQTGGFELGNCIRFRIGGMLDNTVGYIYVSDKKNVPVMNPRNLIMLREIGNGWYVYKTT